MKQLIAATQQFAFQPGDSVHETLGVNAKFNYFGVVVDGEHLTLDQASKARAIRGLIKSRTYYQNHLILPVAVFWAHHTELAVAMRRLGFYTICVNSADLKPSDRAQYHKTINSYVAENFRFKTCYWLRLPDTEQTNLSQNDVTKNIVDTIERNNGQVVTLDAAVYEAPQVTPQEDDPAARVREIKSVTDLTEDMKYSDFKFPDQVQSIEPTVPLIVPEGVMELHDNQPHVWGING